MTLGVFLAGRHKENHAPIRSSLEWVLQQLEWAVAERRYLSEDPMANLYAEPVVGPTVEEVPLAITA